MQQRSKSPIWLTPLPHSLRMREPEALPVAVRKQEFFIRNALTGHCLIATLFPHFSKKFSAKYFLQASRKVLQANFSAKRKSNNEKECFVVRQSAIIPLFALTPGIPPPAVSVQFVRSIRIFPLSFLRRGKNTHRALAGEENQINLS